MCCGCHLEVNTSTDLFVTIDFTLVNFVDLPTTGGMRGFRGAIPDSLRSVASFAYDDKIGTGSPPSTTATFPLDPDALAPSDRFGQSSAVDNCAVGCD